MPTQNNTNDSWLVVAGVPGLTIAPSGTPLTRLHYFDGKFLRASDLELEQAAQRQLVHLSNRAGGFGVVHGFDTRLLVGDMLEVGPGQAIDAQGKVLLLPMEVSVSITELIARSQQLANPGNGAGGQANQADKAADTFCDCTTTESSTATPGTVAGSGNLWLITIAHAEFLCGDEDVYGKLCEQACVGSSERPFRIEGVSLRARPLTLSTPLVGSSAVPLLAKHLRSRVASAYFTDERTRPASLISGIGLRSKAWCLGADLADGEVALGVLCRQGTSNLWFDAWTVRRERMDGPPRDYWAHRMAMRPWREYLAQILQFQCQLAELLCAIVSEGGQPLDPCADEKATLSAAKDAITQLLAQWAEAGVEQAGEIGAITVKALANLQAKLGENGSAGGTTSGQQVLIDGGIVELPPAGYLPVDPNAAMTVNEQVRRLLGNGVDLRFCVIRPDDAARELEGAQHMDRISLLSGLDDPSKLPPVDILVPDGRIVANTQQVEGLSFRAKLGAGPVPDDFSLDVSNEGQSIQQGIYQVLQQLAATSSMRFRGVARAARTIGGGGVAHMAALAQPKAMVGFQVGELASIANLPKAAESLKAKYVYQAKQAQPKQPLEFQAVQNMLFGGQKLGVKGPNQAQYDNPLDVQGNEGDAIAQPSMGLWFDMNASGDPFAVPLGSSLGVAFELRFAKNQEAGSYKLNGQLKVETRQKLVSNSVDYGTIATGKFTGYEAADGFAGVSASSSSEYNVLVLDLTPSGAVDGLLISLSPVQGKALIDNDVMLAWNGQTLDVSGLWIFRPLENPNDNPNNGNGNGDEKQFVVSELDEDPAVQSITDPDHIAALQAIQLIANAGDEPEFAKLAADKLFPPLPNPLETLTIEAVRDWVLFHARHRHECAPKPAVFVGPALRRYQLFALGVDSLDQYTLVSHALIDDAAILAEFEFVDIGTLEFRGGIAALETPADVIKTLWTPHGDDRLLVWAGIASVGAAAGEGDAIAYGRLQTLEAVIETVSPPSPEQSSVVLAKVPHVLKIANLDGAIVLLHGPVAQTLPNVKFTVWTTSSGLEDISSVLASPDILDISKLIESALNSSHIIDCVFPHDSATPVTHELFDPMPDSDVPVAYIISRTSDNTLPAQAMLAAQTLAAYKLANVNAQIGGYEFVQKDYTWDEQAYGRVVVILPNNW